MSSDSENWTATDLQRALIKKASAGNPGAPPEILSSPTKKTALALANYIYYYDTSDPDRCDDIENDEMYRLLMTRLETLTAWDATRSGDVSSMRGIAGRNGEGRTDVSQMEWIDVVDDLIRPDDRDHMLNLTIYAPPPPEGPTGVGKSDFAYTFIDTAQKLNSYQISSNNTSDPFEDVQAWSELEEWLESTDGEKIFLFDEGSQELMYDDMNTGKALSNLIKLLRKHNCHLILIGHTGKDIPKDVRRMMMFCLKESKKKAEIGAGLEEDQAGWMQIKDVHHRLEKIPATSISYDSYGDKGSFDFDIGENQEQEDESDSEVLQCMATTNSGDRCPHDAKYPRDHPLVCKSHRHKMDEFEDVDDGQNHSECRVCDREVGIDSDGFCPDHTEDDLE